MRENFSQKSFPFIPPFKNLLERKGKKTGSKALKKRLLLIGGENLPVFYEPC